MPLPFILGGIALGSLIIGAKKGYDAYSDTSEAKDLIDKAAKIYNHAKRDLSSTKRSTAQHLSNLGKLKLEVWKGEMGRFVRLYAKLKSVKLKRVKKSEDLRITGVKKGDLAVYKDLSLKATSVLKGGAAGIGTGALVGVASYGGAMMFASASTGTAISTLSGAAATNATLAWFGGGAMATGGLGMAGGAAVMGGLVAGPAIAIGAFVIAAKARENLAKAKSECAKARRDAEELRLATSGLRGVRDVSVQFKDEIKKTQQGMTKALGQLERVIRKSGKDYAKFSEKEKKVVWLNVIYAQVMKSYLETPILKKSGALAPGCAKALKKGRKAIEAV